MKLSKKFIAIVIIAVACVGLIGYFVGQKKMIVDNKAKEDAYNKSADAAKATTARVLNDMKFNDLAGIYDEICADMKGVSKEQYLENSGDTKFFNTSSGNSVGTIEVTDANIIGDSASTHVSIGMKNPLFSQERIENYTFWLKLKNGNWCFDLNKTKW